MKDVAIEAAKKAGEIALHYFSEEKGIQKKGAVDLVTKADIEAEKKIVEFIKEIYPEHGFILEEGDDLDTDKEYVWVIDPIDGTTSFAHGYPMFSISIALFRNKEPILGVVYAPYMKELFYAEKGKGAYLNDKKIGVSGTDIISDSLISTGFPYTRIETDVDNITYLKKAVKHVQGIRRSGSAAIDVCYVACGRTDGYWELGLKIMDTAAALLILKEAGGEVTDFEGKNISQDYTKVVATNGLIHKELLKILGE